MRVNAQILSVDNRSGVSQKTGRDYSINEVYLIDTESAQPEVIRANVNEEDMQAVRALVGKTAVIHVFSKSGNFRFGGQVLQSQPKAVNA